LVRISKLFADGKVGDRFDVVVAEIHAGKLSGPEAGAVLYELFDGGDAMQGHANMAVATPGATTESIGLPSEPDAYRPWLMLEGTPMAHIMIQGK